jgi:hypothetical protein
MKEILSILLGAFAGLATFFGLLLVSVPKDLDDGPGLTIGMMFIFGIVPLFFTTLIARLVSLAAGSRAWRVSSLACAVLTSAAFGAFVLHIGYGSLLGLPTLAAGLGGGAVAGGLAAVVAGGPKHPI